jgi:hypothetical protein
MGSKMSKENGEGKNLRQQIRAGEKGFRDQVKANQLSRHTHARSRLIDGDYSAQDVEAATRKPDPRNNARKHGGTANFCFRLRRRYMNSRRSFKD